MSVKKQTTRSEEETHALAAEFAKQLKGGELVELIGDLGSGKTTFVRGIAKAIGSSARVKSPTFTIMNEYPVTGHRTIKRLAHLDLYRFKNPSQLEALALGDYQADDTVVFVEWPDAFGDSAFSPTRQVRFAFVDEQTREIEF